MPYLSIIEMVCCSVCLFIFIVFWPVEWPLLRDDKGSDILLPYFYLQECWGYQAAFQHYGNWDLVLEILETSLVICLKEIPRFRETVPTVAERDRIGQE